MIPTAETLKLVCLRLFDFEPDGGILATNGEFIKEIISRDLSKESVGAFYDYISGDESHETEDKAWKVMREIKECRAVYLIDAFVLPIEEIKRRYDIDSKRHRAYNFFTLKVADMKYPSSIAFTHYLEMICRCLEANGRLTKFTE